jgi:hypothetical protein
MHEQPNPAELRTVCISGYIRIVQMYVRYYLKQVRAYLLLEHLMPGAAALQIFGRARGISPYVRNPTIELISIFNRSN